MNQAQLIEAISSHHSNTGTSKTSIKWVLDTLADVAKSEVQKGEGAEVALPGIGKIVVKQSPARIGRNPSTGAEVQIPARNKPHFTAAKALKDAANSN
ncbi:MAG: HU family DNA-binding protein [Gallionella sp.]|nr:HU family DNA-binding protein [Gallionella sp.]MDD4947433.1 HU family DNA-binding protein [Gallionella sp.]MDD5612446.1 HU family DNA-binding protein [Gallionella sp.]